MTEQRYDFVYRDTVDFINCIISDYDFYGEMIRAMQSGESQISLHKKQLIKQIDENWVFAIENALPALDMVIRNPMRMLEEHEEILPIELTRSVSEKAIRHLAQHTNLINDIDEEGNITPSHLLNIYRDETIATYENKFVNTLLDRLYFFVEKRYSRLKESANDENSTVMDFETAFDSDKAEAKVHFTIEVKSKEQASQEEELDEFGIPVVRTTLWERVERIRRVLNGYLGSDFVKQLHGQFVRPPIMRTNAITKNKDLKVCLELWQFIQSYDKIGYEIRSNETAEAPSQSYIDELYSLMALQYVTFQYNVNGALEEEKALASQQEAPVHPRIITDFTPLEVDEFNVYDVQTQKYVKWSQTASRKRLTPQELKVREAIDNALAADKRLKELEAERQRELERLAEEKRRVAEQERLRKAREKETERLRRQQEKEKKRRHSKKGRLRAKHAKQEKRE